MITCEEIESRSANALIKSRPPGSLSVIDNRGVSNKYTYPLTRNSISIKFIVEMSVLPLNYFANFPAKGLSRRTGTTTLNLVRIKLIVKLIPSLKL